MLAPQPSPDARSNTNDHRRRSDVGPHFVVGRKASMRDTKNVAFEFRLSLETTENPVTVGKSKYDSTKRHDH